MSLTRASFDIAVNWPANSKLTWIDKNDDFYKKTGIKCFRMWASGNPFYTYEVGVITDVPYHYTFYDETGDSYSLNVIFTGSDMQSGKMHDVMYNSDRPTIVRIVGKWN